MCSSGGVETKQKQNGNTPQQINHVIFYVFGEFSKSLVFNAETFSNFALPITAYKALVVM